MGPKTLIACGMGLGIGLFCLAIGLSGRVIAPPVQAQSPTNENFYSEDNIFLPESNASCSIVVYYAKKTLVCSRGSSGMAMRPLN